MIVILIVCLIFAAGFGSGYAVRADISRRRRERSRRHALYGPPPAARASSVYGHPRRAF